MLKKFLNIMLAIAVLGFSALMGIELASIGYCTSQLQGPDSQGPICAFLLDNSALIFIDRLYGLFQNMGQDYISNSEYTAFILPGALGVLAFFTTDKAKSLRQVELVLYSLSIFILIFSMVQIQYQEVCSSLEFYVEQTCEGFRQMIWSVFILMSGYFTKKVWNRSEILIKWRVK